MIYVPAVSLVALRLLKPEHFYAQDWYLTHGFAALPVEPAWYEPILRREPAAVLVWTALEALRCGQEPPFTRLDTTDTDAEGHPVYVQYGPKGIEVHRYLEAPVKCMATAIACL